MARTLGEAAEEVARPALRNTILWVARTRDHHRARPVGNMAKTVTIHRDRCGVPQIYAPTDASVVFGLMYAQADATF